jgi:LEA14-like dessication related protein
MKMTTLPRRALLYSTYFAALLLFASSCQTPKELEYRDFKNVSVEKMGFASTTLKVELVYYNPNNFGLQLKYTDLDVFVDNVYLGHSSQDYQIIIPRREEFTLPMQIEVDMKNLLKNSLASLTGKEVMVKVTGTVKLGKANVFKTFPVNYEGLHKFSAF